jgi:GTP-binding protein
MFIDEVEIYVKAGNGGNGAVSFRREKYIPNGGPNGGDGGRGGNVVFEVTNQLHGLAEYNQKPRYIAENGQNGMSQNMSGKNAKDLILQVPPGTQIYEKGDLLLDLTEEGQRIVFLKGGNGGWGNQHFATSIKQAPKWAKEGMRGESKKIRLVLRTIADIGLVGLPNAGKSTLLSVLTNARPKIADYPFTTLEPNLGTYIDKDVRIILADIPGLIEGAAQGKGLGDKFLKHVERTKILVHLIDANSSDVIKDYNTIREELKEFSKELPKKKKIVVLNKIETVPREIVEDEIKELKKITKDAPIAISAATHENIRELVNKIKKSL